LRENAADGVIGSTIDGRPRFSLGCLKSPDSPTLICGADFKVRRPDGEAVALTGLLEGLVAQENVFWNRFTHGHQQHFQTLKAGVVTVNFFATPIA